MKHRLIKILLPIKYQILALLFFPVVLFASVTISWQEVSESDLAGYIMYMGTKTGIYTDSTDVGKVTSFELNGLETGQTYYLIIRAYDNWGNQSLPSNEYMFIYNGSTGINNPANPIPNDFSLAQNYPNPFNPQTTIEFSTKETGYVTLSIYNLLGEEIKRLVDNYFESTAQERKITWDGTNNEGALVASGVYFYTLKQNDLRITKRMILAR